MKKQDFALTANGEPLRAYSPEYFAKTFNLHVETVREALRTGRLPGVRFGSHWRVTHATMMAVLTNGLPSLNVKNFANVDNNTVIHRGLQNQSSK